MRHDPRAWLYAAKRDDHHADQGDRPAAGAGRRGFAVPFAHLGQGRSGVVIRILRNHTALILLVVLVIAGGMLSDVFLTPRNLLNIMWAVSILGIVALGQTMLLITCNFDMSVAFVVGLAGIITVLAQIAGFDLVTSMAFGLAGGMAIGLVNGLLVVYTGANPFLITLGTALLAYSASLTLTHSQTLYATIPAFNVLGRGRLFGVVHYSVRALPWCSRWCSSSSSAGRPSGARSTSSASTRPPAACPACPSAASS